MTQTALEARRLVGKLVLVLIIATESVAWAGSTARPIVIPAPMTKNMTITALIPTATTPA